MAEKSVAAQLRALADQLEGGLGQWPWGINEFSPPDDLDRVSWKFIEDEILPEFGTDIKNPVLNLDGSVTYLQVEVPRSVHLRQTAAPGTFGYHNAANASFLAPFNCSRLQIPGNAPEILRGTFSAWDDDLDSLKRKFRRRCQNLRDGNVFAVQLPDGTYWGFSGVSSDPDPGR